jgi:cell division protein FtsB
VSTDKRLYEALELIDRLERELAKLREEIAAKDAEIQRLKDQHQEDLELMRDMRERL